MALPAAPVPTGGKWEVKDHVRVKHKILKSYMDGWIPILATRKQLQLYIDTFAGPGMYLETQPDGTNKDVDGSPVMLMKSLFAHPLKDRIGQMHLYFVEKDQVRHQTLTRALHPFQNVNGKIKVSVHNNDFDTLFPKLMAHYTQSLQQVQEIGVFAFIDPFGFKLDFAKVAQVLRFDHGEVFVNFMTGPLNRFVCEQSRAQCVENLFGTDVWKQETSNKQQWKSKTPLARQQYLVGLYQSQLIAAGAAYTFAFKIRNISNVVLYHLVFATRSLKGLEVMKAAMWKNQFDTGLPGERLAFSDKYAETVDGVLQVHGAGLTLDDIRDAANLVYENFKGQVDVSFDTVRAFVLQETDFVWAVSILNKLIEDRKIVRLFTPWVRVISDSWKKGDGQHKWTRPSMDFAVAGAAQPLLSEMLAAKYSHQQVSWNALYAYVHQDTWFGIKSKQEELRKAVHAALTTMLGSNPPTVALVPTAAGAAVPKKLTKAAMLRGDFDFLFA